MGRARRIPLIPRLDPGGKSAVPVENNLGIVSYQSAKQMTHWPHHVMPAPRVRPKAGPRTGSSPASTPLLVQRGQGVDAGAKPRHDEEGQAQRRSLSDSAFEPGLSATQACAQDAPHDKGPPAQRFTDFTLLATADAA
jgi:hypothetical protein